METIKPEFLKEKKTIYDRVNIIYFWKVQVQSEKCNVIKISSEVMKVSSSPKPNG